MAGNGNPNSLANLRPPFKKGQSGNPSGRAKKEITKEDWQEFASESAGADKNGKALPSRERMVMLANFKCATDTRRKDCTAAQRIFFERVQGKAPDVIALSVTETGEANPIETILNGMIARKVSEKKAAEEEEAAAESGSTGPEAIEPPAEPEATPKE